MCSNNCYIVGAYSDSRGTPAVRKEVAEFIQRRDGYPRYLFMLHTRNVFYSALQKNLINGHKFRFQFVRKGD